MQLKWIIGYELWENFDSVSPKASKLNRLLCSNTQNESKFTSTCEEIQNQCIPILFDTLFWI
jgi:hypothetical protein